MKLICTPKNQFGIAPTFGFELQIEYRRSRGVLEFCMSEQPQCECPQRRDFLKEFSCVAVGASIGLVPVAAGVYSAMDPLRRKASSSEPVRVTTIEALPADGVPMKFAIIADKTDAWNKYPATPIGAIYLRKVSEGKVMALSSVCPHAGCFVDYRKDAKDFFCPCHNSNFSSDGAIKSGVSPRAMDALDVEVRAGGEVWVKFQNFKAGHPQKLPVS